MTFSTFSTFYSFYSSYFLIGLATTPATKLYIELKIVSLAFLVYSGVLSIFDTVRWLFYAELFAWFNDSTSILDLSYFLESPYFF